MIDHAGRTIDYARISITDRCDLRCIYCMPEGGVPALRHDEILSFEEIEQIGQALCLLGVRYLKITGGEPMARRGCLDLVKRLKDLPGIEEVTLTTNGIQLAGKMQQAKAAGLTGLNISLDTLDPHLFHQMTRVGDVHKTLETIREAVALSMPVKVNCVPIADFNEDSLCDLCALGKDAPIHVRFIELMPLGCASGFRPIPQERIKELITNAFGTLTPDLTRHGNGPAAYYTLPGFKGSVGFISAVSHEFCDQCNRVRITAQGELKLCLNRKEGVQLAPLLRAGISTEDLSRVIGQTIYEKPLRHGFTDVIDDREDKKMYQIGG